MNKFEEKINKQLSLARTKGGYRFAYEGTKINYVKPEPMRVYTPDFLVCLPDGRQIFIETKGYFRPEHRTKMRHVKRCNPTLDIRMVFMKDQLINKKTGFSYSKWCERNDFPCAFGTIPTEWLE